MPVSSSYADETSEAILKLLIKKGIISQREVNEIKGEIRRGRPSLPGDLEERVERLEEKQVEAPEWIKNMKLKGDLRLRNEYLANDLGQDNNRQRIRFRLGATTKLNEQVKVGFGIASGSSDTPTSTNQSLEQEFQSKNIWLDYAYVSYDPYDWVHLIGGKFKSPFFHTDMLWDSDIRFEGVAGKVTHKLAFLEDSNLSTKVSLAGGYFPLENLTTSVRDPYLLVGQLGSETKFKAAGSKLKAGLAFYDFKALENQLRAALTGNKGTNVTINGRYEDYRVISPTLKYSAPTIFGLVDLPAGLIGEYASNTSISTEDEAWRLGAWLGQSKVKKKGQWRLLSQYSYLEADAFVDAFPDGDFNDAGTNAKGWEAIFDYGLADNVILSFDYYNTESISGAKADDEIIQADLIFKF